MLHCYFLSFMRAGLMVCRHQLHYVIYRVSNSHNLDAVYYVYTLNRKFTLIYTSQ